MSRPLLVGPADGPEEPFPIKLSGRIVRGFGRGSKELGIPTANIPITGLDVGGHTNIASGIYYGWAGLNLSGVVDDASKAAGPVGAKSTASHEPAPEQAGSATDKHDIYPMVMSIGWNPFYNNEMRTVEVHIIHAFKADFYNAKLNLTILGFIRDEKNYDSMDALVTDIKFDIDVAKASLERPAYASLKDDPYLADFSWAG